MKILKIFRKHFKAMTLQKHFFRIFSLREKEKSEKETEKKIEGEHGLLCVFT